MRVSKFRLERQIAFCLVAVLLAPVSVLAAGMPQAAASTPGAAAAETSTSAAAVQSTSTPSSATVASPPNSSPPATPSEAPAQATDQNQTGGAQTAQPQQQTPAPAALGTAAAPFEKQSGVSGSKPAGAAIAPGKQRRTHSFAIRVALLVGAAVAIGVVVAASASSPNRAN